MLKLLNKEIKLSMHPSTPVMLLLSAMVLIPNYPYSIALFYVTMSIFFTCLLGRENNDVVYSLTLPITKKEIVKGRISFAVILQILQLIITIPFAILSQKINVTCNQAGLEANITWFAVAFILYGVFNLVFFSKYYKNVNKVGSSFLVSSIVIFIGIIIEIVATYAIPFVRDVLDTKDPEFLNYKLIALVIGIIIYSVFTSIVYKKSVKNFEKQDL